MKRWMRMLAALLIVGVTLMGSSALADVAITTTATVNLRTGPGTGYLSICTIGPGTRLTYDRSERGTGGGLWYRVTYNGWQGWVSAAYAGQAAETRVTTTHNVNLRKGAGTAYAALDTVPSGTALTVEKSGKDADGATWYRVTWGGRTGWIIAKYTRSGEAASGKVTTTGDVNLRSGAGLDYASRDTVPSGRTLVYGRTERDARGVLWYRVRYNGQTGWISSMYAGPGGASAGGQVKTTGSVNLRAGAGLGYASLRTVGEGVTLSFDQTKVDERGVAWYHVTYQGVKGWVSSRYTSVGAQSDGERVKLTGDAHIRTGPGLDYASIGTARNGETLSYRGSAERDDRGVTWYAVTFEGRKGWVSSRYSKLL